MVVELCAGNFATYDGLVMELMEYSKHQHLIITKPQFRFCSQIKKIKVLTREKSTHFYIDNIQPNWTPIEPIIKDIRINKNNISYYNKNSISNSISSSKNHSPITRIIIR